MKLSHVRTDAITEYEDFSIFFTAFLPILFSRHSRYYAHAYLDAIYDLFKWYDLFKYNTIVARLFFDSFPILYIYLRRLGLFLLSVTWQVIFTYVVLYRDIISIFHAIDDYISSIIRSSTVITSALYNTRTQVIMRNTSQMNANTAKYLNFRFHYSSCDSTNQKRRNLDFFYLDMIDQILFSLFLSLSYSTLYYY